MKILIIGSGGRESALAQRLLQESNELYIITDRMNPKYLSLNCCIEVLELSRKNILQFALKHRVDLVFVLHEKYIGDLADSLKTFGIRCCFPTKELTFLEQDKLATQSLVSNLYPQVRPPLRKFDSYSSLLEYCSYTKDKIVLLTSSQTQVLTYEQLQAKKSLNQVVWMDQYFDGTDISIYAFVNGNQILFFPPIFDFPHLQIGENKIKTGGMGALFLPSNERSFISSVAEEKCRDTISRVVQHLTLNQMKFEGFLVGQFRVQKDDVLFIEFDMRPGEPQMYNILSAFKNSITESLILPFLHDQVTSDDSLFDQDKASLSVCVAPLGYPQTTKSGTFDLILDETSSPCSIYWNGGFIDEKGLLRHDGRRIFTIFAEGTSHEQVKTIHIRILV